MKAIMIHSKFSNFDLEQLNNDLKNCQDILYYQKVNEGSLSECTILIVNNYTRKDKLEKLNDISNEGTNNNSI